MAEEAPAAAPAKAPAKSPKKKKAAARPKKDGPSISKLLVSAVTESKERKGMSLAALKKVLAGKGVDVTKANKRINTAVTKLVTKGTLSQTKGTGASGSFKLAKEERERERESERERNILYIYIFFYSLHVLQTACFLHFFSCIYLIFISLFNKNLILIIIFHNNFSNIFNYFI
uniref:H15 domain-containing protein n=1 Tax=Oryzias latipes TaxID=8090 RepID=A0A3P9IPV4_ORYLA